MKKICAIIILEVIAINSFCITPREVSINNNVNRIFPTPHKESESQKPPDIPDDFLTREYSDEFKTAVREDILRRLDEENGFAEEFKKVTRVLDDDTVREIAYSKYSQKPEFMKRVAEAEEENKRYNLFPLFVGGTVCLIIILLGVLVYVCLKIKSLKPIKRIQPKITKMKEDMGTFFTSLAQLDKFSRSDKKRIAVSFALGIIVGASIVYLLTNRYVSYPSYRSCIVRMDRLTGKTEIASAYNPEGGWMEVKKSKR